MTRPYVFHETLKSPRASLPTTKPLEANRKPNPRLLFLLLFPEFVARYPRYCWTCAALRNRCRISPFPGLVTPIVEIRRLVPGLCSALLWLTLEWSVLPGFRHSSDPSHITDAACSRPSCEADDGSLGGGAEAGSPRNWLARRQRISSHGSGAPFYATSQPQASPSRPSLATPSAVVPVRPTNFDPSPALFSLMPNSPAPQGAPESPLPQRYFAVEIAAQPPLGPAIRYGSTPRRHTASPPRAGGTKLICSTSWRRALCAGGGALVLAAAALLSLAPPCGGASAAPPIAYAAALIQGGGAPARLQRSARPANSSRQPVEGLAVARGWSPPLPHHHHIDFLGPWPHPAALPCSAPTNSSRVSGSSAASCPIRLHPEAPLERPLLSRYSAVEHTAQLPLGQAVRPLLLHPSTPHINTPAGGGTKLI